MPELFGHTRAAIGARHALITPDNHVPAPLPGLEKASAVVLTNPAMGAGFAQIQVTFESGGGGTLPGEGLETFGYVMAGGLTVTLRGAKHRLTEGGYFFAPAGCVWLLSAARKNTRLTFFQKNYEDLPGVAPPPPRVGNSNTVKGAPFLGDPAADLKVLLPDTPAHDWAVNLFTYQPGGHLPFVEVHVMEHGLVMLAGQGVYRLEDRWYPVQAGDVIWMAPYCAQWFVAMGKTPARYLYFKDVNRPVL